jgi:hypothetical protein
MEGTAKKRPLVSIIVEGYNQMRDLGSADETDLPPMTPPAITRELQRS